MSFGCIAAIGRTALPYWRTVAGSGSLHMMSANLFNQSLGFISSLFVVKFLKPAELGETRIITTYAGYVVLLGTLGLTASVLTFAPRPEYAACRRRWLHQTMLFAAGVTILWAVVAIVLSSRGWLMTDPQTAYWYRWSLLGAVATSASSILIAFYQAERAVRELAGVQSAVRLLAVSLVVAGAWLAGFEGYVVAGIIGAYLMLAGLLLVLRRDTTPSSPLPLPPGYLRVGLLALMGSLLWTAGRTADVVILDKIVANRAEFGCYALALAVSGILAMLNQTVQVVAIPFFSARHQDRDWILRHAGKWQVVGIITGILAAAAVFAIAWLLVRYVYGAPYRLTVSFLAPLLLAQCLLATFHIQAGALMGTGLVKVNTSVAAAVVPMSILATFVLARNFGIWGAAWAQVLAAAFYAAAQSFWGWRALDSARIRPAAARAESWQVNA